MNNYERVTIEARSYLVCAKCRRPIPVGLGYSPVAIVPEPGEPNPNPWAQALCGPCSQEQYALVYPLAEVPVLPDGRLPGVEPILHPGARAVEDAPVGSSVIMPISEAESRRRTIAIWREAIDAAEASGGSETVEQAYERIALKHPPDVEITEPLNVDDQVASDIAEILDDNPGDEVPTPAT